jgi:hypothetical protein
MSKKKKRAGKRKHLPNKKPNIHIDNEIDQPSSDTEEKTPSISHHHRKKHSKETNEPTIEEELRSIYELDANENEGVNMGKLDIVTKPLLRRILVATLLIMIAIAAGLTGSLLLNEPFSSQPTDALTFDISLEDEEMISGQPSIITIPYHNPSDIPLANLELIVHLPDSFIVTAINPETTQTQPYTWTLGSVSPNEQGEVIITGVLFSTPGSAETIQAITRYEPANFSSPFEAIVTKSILVSESSYSVKITGPDRVIPDKTENYVVTVNATEGSIEQPLELALDFPNSFRIENSSIEIDETRGPIWLVDPFPSEEPFEFEFQGIFSSDTGASHEQIITATVNAVINKDRIKQDSSELTTNVLASNQTLSLVANGQSSDSIILPGDDLILNVALRNRGEETAENIKVTLIVESGSSRLDLGLRSGIPDGTREGSTIVWDSSDMSRLENLRGTEDASIDISIPTLDSGSDTIVIRAIATIETIGGIKVEQTLNSSTISVQIASDLQSSSSARYYDSNGFPVGAGPIPPLVGQRTTYRVTWSLANGLHDVRDLQMTAPIPERATWGGIVSVTDGSLSYDPVSARIRWTMNTLGTEITPPIAVFDIHVIPTIDDVGTFVDIISPASVSAEDIVTGSLVRSEASGQTTELQDDPGADGKGAVLEE